jgi:hypothetical protein
MLLIIQYCKLGKKFTRRFLFKQPRYLHTCTDYIYETLFFILVIPQELNAGQGAGGTPLQPNPLFYLSYPAGAQGGPEVGRVPASAKSSFLS